jgi:hypothetical protein
MRRRRPSANRRSSLVITIRLRACGTATGPSLDTDVDMDNLRESQLFQSIHWKDGVNSLSRG